MFVVRLALLFATLLLLVAVVKLLVSLALVLAIGVFAVLAARYARTFLSAALRGRPRPVTPLAGRTIRIARP